MGNPRPLLGSIAVIAVVLGGGAYLIAAAQRDAVTGIDRARYAEADLVAIDYGDIEQTRQLTGRIVAGETVPVVAHAAGELLAVFVEASDTVEQGQLVARIDPAQQELRVRSSRLDLEIQRNLLEPLQFALQMAENDFRRLAEQADNEPALAQAVADARARRIEARSELQDLLARIDAGSEQLQREEDALESTELFAPIAGTVASIEMQPGSMLELVDPPPTIIEILDLKTITVEAEVFESDLGALAQASAVYVTTFSGGDKRWYGELDQLLLLPAPYESEALYVARFDLDNSDSSLFPQMTAQVFFVTASAKDVLRVPIAALTFPDASDPARAIVDVVQADGTNERREIRLGAADSFFAEIVSGLEAGDTIVAERNAGTLAGAL